MRFTCARRRLSSSEMRNSFSKLPVVLGELALKHRNLIGCQRREHRRRVFGRLGGEPAVTRAHAGEPPGDVLRGDAAGGALARAAHQRRVGRKLVGAMPLVELRDAQSHLLPCAGSRSK